MNTSIRIDTGTASAKLAEAQKLLADGRSMFQRIAAALRQQTLENFNAGGRPSWVPLKASTIAARKKGKKGSSVLRILQDSRMLRDSLSTDHGADFAQVGANTPYAAIHQLGGTIERAPSRTKVRLRTDEDGNLQRQRKHRNLAVFAKEDEGQVRESWHEVGAFTVNIPARPYLPFLGAAQSGVLQPEAEKSILDIVTAAIEASLR